VANYDVADPIEDLSANESSETDEDSQGEIIERATHALTALRLGARPRGIPRRQAPTMDQRGRARVHHQTTEEEKKMLD